MPPHKHGELYRGCWRHAPSVQTSGVARVTSLSLLLLQKLQLCWQESRECQVSSSPSARVKTAKTVNAAWERKLWKVFCSCEFVHQQSRFPFLGCRRLCCFYFLQPNPPHILSFILRRETGDAASCAGSGREWVGGLKGCMVSSIVHVSSPLHFSASSSAVISCTTAQSKHPPHRMSKRISVSSSKPFAVPFFLWSCSTLAEKFSFIARQHMSHVLLHTVFLLREKLFGVYSQKLLQSVT